MSNPTKNSRSGIVLLYVLLFLAFGFMALATKAQLTVEGKIISAPGVTATLTQEHGATIPVKIRGKKQKYRVTIDDPNSNHLLTFNSNGVTKEVHIHTHLPDGVRVRYFVELDVRFTQDMPAESVIYYSPSSDHYIWRSEIKQEDRIRLIELNLWPRRIHDIGTTND